MKISIKTIAVSASLMALAGAAIAANETVSDDVVAAQRANLAASTDGAGFGPQSPRDLDTLTGANTLVFEEAPEYTQMNLCNIHFHKNAEHRGGDFTTYAGNGDGKGFGTGYKYSGSLSDAETAPIDVAVGQSDHGSLVPGDTIEVHYVHSSAQITPGPTLGACLSESIMNPQLRVETQVYVLVNDESALDFTELAAIGEVNGFSQALNIPTDTGTPIEYPGSTTGPSYNEKGSPLQVTWSVRPGVAKVNILSVAAWFENNPFDEDHAHGVRNLVVNPDLISNISQ